MEEQLITFETAKLAKEKGYKIEPDIWGEYALYKSDGLKAKGNKSFYLLKFEEEDGEVFPLTTQALLKKWLREKRFIDIVRISPLNVFTFYLAQNTIPFEVDGEILFITEKTYEKALEKGLQEGLNLI